MLKEFIQLKRDRLTFGMIIGIPVIQLILFGFAINSDPKQLPTAVLLADHGSTARTLLWALKNSGYFASSARCAARTRPSALLAQGDVQFVITVPENFSRKLVRGERPALLVEADATDPVGDRQRDRGAERHRAQRARARPAGLARAPQSRARSGRAARAPALQPGGRHAVQHRARACSA